MQLSRQVLLGAAIQLEEELVKLDTATEVCPCCGLNKRSNWTEWQGHQELAALVRKLRAMAGSNLAA